MSISDKNILSKEAIASRMFRHAARFWGYNDTNMDNFDPLVRLLIEACSVEMYGLHNEIVSVQERMLEKLSKLLVPASKIHSKPAHAVMHARSTDVETYVTPVNQFYYQKKVATKSNGPLDATLDIFFSPAGNFKVIEGDVALIASGTNIYSVNQWQQKEVFLKTLPNKRVSDRTLWLGIDINRSVEDLSNITLFFDFKNLPDKERLLSLIKFAQVSVNDTPVHMHSGLKLVFEHTASQDADAPAKGNFEKEFEQLFANESLESNTQHHYRNNFLTISTHNSVLKNLQKTNLKQRYPSHFEKILGPKELSKFGNELLWIKIVFPAEFNEEILEDMVAGINCFPVINRQLNELSYRLNSFFNIIPIATSAPFLAMRSVEGTVKKANGDKFYSEYPFEHFEEGHKGIYSVRNGELERFDSRRAIEYLNYMIEILREESRTFASLGQDFIANTIKEVNQNIALIEQKIKQNTADSNIEPSYLLLNPLEENDTIFVQYWTTNGKQANYIRSGSQFDLFSGSDLFKDSIMLMTTTSGGQDKLNSIETLNTFKSALLTRERIVSKQDILLFCKEFLQDKLINVEVKKGVHLSDKPKEGLIQTIDIHLTLETEDNENAEELAAIQQELLSNLELKSAVDATYKIILN